METYWNNVCSFIGSIPIPPVPMQQDVNGLGAQQVSAIINFVGYPALIPVLIQPGCNNAFAVLGHPNLVGDEAIIYDPVLLNRLLSQYGLAAPIAILAHEVGHRVTGVYVPDWIPDLSDETRADYFAGYILGKFKITRRPIQIWFQNETMPDYRHPDGYTRSWAIEHGYIAGGGSPWEL